MVVTCAGPDAHGECPSLMAGHAPACQTATWHVQTDSGQAWSFRFRNSLQACPVTMLTSTPPVVGGTAT
jgi:hypothetical protein